MPKTGSARDFMQIPALRFRVEATATPPLSPVVGQQWTDTSTTPGKLRWWNGSAWIAADGTSIPGGYIDNTLISPTANIALSKLATDPVARANHTGTQPASTISDFDAQVRSNRLDQLAAPTNNVDVNGVRFTNVANPVAPGDAANKLYVDNSRAGISVKDPVRVVANGNINLASPGATIDGVAMNAGERFLARAQNTGTENGIYEWNGATTAATRPADADSAGDVPDGALVTVAEGSSEGYQYIQRAVSGGTPGSWTQDWGVFAIGGQTYTPGNGLAITGTQFYLDAPVTVANGGTGATTPKQARANLGAVTKFAGDLGALTAGVTYTVTHNLDTFDVGAWFRTVADNQIIDFSWAPASANTVEVFPDLGFAAGSVRAVLVG